MKEYFLKNEKQISRIATVVVFLGLIRAISEPLRLQYISSSPLSFEEIKPFLIGALIPAIGLLIITISSFYNKYIYVIIIAVLIIIGMLTIKYIYLR